MNESARNKFVKDFMLPIPVTSNKEYFEYFVGLYEQLHESQTLWNMYTKVVEILFDGNPDSFQNYNSKFCKFIVQTVSELPAFETLSQYNPPNDPQAVSSFLEKNQQLHSNVYNRNFHEKFFISIDLKKANFQALKQFNPELVFQCDTYEQFMEKMLDQFEASERTFKEVSQRDLLLQYVLKSKMLRQVIFGKLNPEKQSKIEKGIMLQLLQQMVDHCNIAKKQIMQITSDEIVLQCNSDQLDVTIQNIQNTLQEKLPQFQTRIQGFQVKSIPSPKRSQMVVGFAKYLWKMSQIELKTVPIHYYAQVYKYLCNLKCNDKDLKFTFENMVAQFEETLF